VGRRQIEDPLRHPCSEGVRAAHLLVRQREQQPATLCPRGSLDLFRAFQKHRRVIPSRVGRDTKGVGASRMPVCSIASLPVTFRHWSWHFGNFLYSHWHSVSESAEKNHVIAHTR
jgi:hypothetical protein